MMKSIDWSDLDTSLGRNNIVQLRGNTGIINDACVLCIDARQYTKDTMVGAREGEYEWVNCSWHNPCNSCDQDYMISKSALRHCFDSSSHTHAHDHLYYTLSFFHTYHGLVTIQTSLAKVQRCQSSLLLLSSNLLLVLPSMAYACHFPTHTLVPHWLSIPIGPGSPHRSTTKETTTPSQQWPRKV